MNNIIGLKELRLNAAKYISQIAKGKSFIVVKQSKPVFKITRVEEDDDGQWESIIDFTKGGKKPGIDASKLLKLMRKYEQNREVSAKSHAKRV